MKGTIAVQASMSSEPFIFNVRLIHCSNPVDSLKSYLEGEKFEYRVIQPKDVGLEIGYSKTEWQKYWSDDVGYMDRDDLQKFMADVAIHQSWEEFQNNFNEEKLA